MNEQQEYAIGELAAAAGVTARTIRYYTAEGVLPPPEMHGKYARYGADHLLRLQLIARLKESYLPLSEIRRRLEELSTADVQALLAEETGPPPLSSAADYLAQVLDTRAPQGPTTSRLAEPPARYRTATPAPAPVSQGKQHMPAAAPPAAEAPGATLRAPSPTAATPAAAPAAPSAAAAPAPSGQRSGGWLGRLLGGRSEGVEAAPAAGERWRRITIAQGVELHVREPQSPEAAPRIAQLIAHAQALFQQREEGNQ